MTCPTCKTVFAFAVPGDDAAVVLIVACPRCAGRRPIAEFQPKLVDATSREVETALGIAIGREAPIDLRLLR